MRELIESVLEGYGGPVTAQTQAGTKQFWGFVQPVTERGWSNTQKIVASLGRIPKECYVLIAQADAAVEEGETLTARAQRFLVRRAEKVYVGDEPMYTWALLTKAGGEAAWSR